MTKADRVHSTPPTNTPISQNGAGRSRQRLLTFAAGGVVAIAAGIPAAAAADPVFVLIVEKLASLTGKQSTCRTRLNAATASARTKRGKLVTVAKPRATLSTSWTGDWPPLQTVGEFAREAAEADIDLQRIRKTRALRFSAVVGNLEAQPETYAQLAEDLVKIERYERRAFSRRNRALRLLTS